MEKKGTEGRLTKGRVRELILSALEKGKRRRKDILDHIKEEEEVEVPSRTFTKNANRLIKEGLVYKPSRGSYMLRWKIPLEDAVKRIEQALKRLADQYVTVTLEDVAMESKVPVAGKWRVGEKEVTFEEIAYGITRELDVKIGPEKSKRKDICLA